MLSKKGRGRLDPAASASPEHPRRAPCTSRQGNGTRRGDRPVLLAGCSPATVISCVWADVSRNGHVYQVFRDTSGAQPVE